MKETRIFSEIQLVNLREKIHKFTRKKRGYSFRLKILHLQEGNLEYYSPFPTPYKQRPYYAIVHTRHNRNYTFLLTQKLHGKQHKAQESTEEAPATLTFTTGHERESLRHGRRVTPPPAQTHATFPTRPWRCSVRKSLSLTLASLKKLKKI